uniref:Ribosomal protein S13 n=1 Tax=Prasinococcus sp. CCMP1194 TaxID=110672 RepID=A0A650AKM3_9VIRI|nr:ribosomal protein S13 [Prasinococcus sp. CCMP1194]
MFFLYLCSSLLFFFTISGLEERRKKFIIYNQREESFPYCPMYILFSDLPLCKGTHLVFSSSSLYLEGPLGRITYMYEDLLHILSFSPSGLAVSLPVQSDTKESEQRAAAMRLVYLLCDRFVRDSYQVGSLTQIELKLQGTGFKVSSSSPDKIDFSVGLSHSIHFPLPEGVSCVLVHPTQFFLFGMDKEKVTRVAAQCCALLPKDVYHGRGIHKMSDLAQLRLKKGKKNNPGRPERFAFHSTKERSFSLSCMVDALIRRYKFSPFLFGFTRIYGIGQRDALFLCSLLGIQPSLLLKDLDPSHITKLERYLEKYWTLEYRLRTKRAAIKKHLTSIGSYRGLRHKYGLPCRGQRTRTNAQTRRRVK